VAVIAVATGEEVKEQVQVVEYLEAEAVLVSNYYLVVASDQQLERSQVENLCC